MAVSNEEIQHQMPELWATRWKMFFAFCLVLSNLYRLELQGTHKKSFRFGGEQPCFARKVLWIAAELVVFWSGTCWGMDTRSGTCWGMDTLLVFEGETWTF